MRQGHLPSNPAAAAQHLQSRCLRNSLVAHSLCDDRWAGNKQYTQNKSNKTENGGISI
jgi:hypothetical protein